VQATVFISKCATGRKRGADRPRQIGLLRLKHLTKMLSYDDALQAEDHISPTERAR